MKAPVRGLNIRQDRCVDDSQPPHRRRPHWLCFNLTTPGRSARWQLFLVLKLNTSTFTPTESLGSPPVIRTPGMVECDVRQQRDNCDLREVKVDDLRFHFLREKLSFADRQGVFHVGRDRIRLIVVHQCTIHLVNI